MNHEPKIVLETDRLILRTWTQADVDKLAVMNMDPRVMEYFPSTQDYQTTVKLIEHSNNLFSQYGFCLYATELKETGEMIGFVGLNIPDFDIPNFKPIQKPIVEMGWRLAFEYWGKGYATEGAKAVLDQGFNTLNLKEIVAFTPFNNLRSRRVMEKIGLKHNEKDDYDAKSFDENNPAKRQVLYRLKREEYLKS